MEGKERKKEEVWRKEKRKRRPRIEERKERCKKERWKERKEGRRR